MTESIHSLSGAYAVDAVDDLERARFERHLTDCADCSAEVAELQAAAGQLAHLAVMTPPARLREQVLKDIREVRPLPPLVQHETVVRIDETRRSLKETGRRPRRATRWLAAAAAVVALGGGSAVVANQLLDNRGSQTQTAIADRVLQDPQAVRKSAVVGTGTVEVVVSKSVGHGVVVASGLAQVPSGRVYQLWLKRGNTFVSAGLMNGSNDQTVVLSGDSTTADAVGVTVEPAGGSVAPTTNPVAMVAVA